MAEAQPRESPAAGCERSAAAPGPGINAGLMIRLRRPNRVDAADHGGIPW